MYQLLRIEWMKLKHFKTFWILTLLFVIFLPLFNFMFSSGVMKLGGNDMAMMTYSFPAVWNNFTFWASWFVIFIAFVIVILITNEYRYRTNRQNLIDGWSRLDFFHAKVLLILKLAGITTIYTGICCLVFGASYSGGFKGVTDDMIRIVYFFILCVNYFGFAMMLSFLMKRSGLVIGIFMIYILMVENILNAWLNWQFKGSFAGDFLPLQSSDALVPLPLMRMAQSLVSEAPQMPSDTSFIIASMIYILIYYMVSRWRLMKSDW